MDLGSKPTKTNDKIVREILIRQLTSSDSRIFEEFDIERGKVRADVVSVSGSMMHGFEIKSDIDTLVRLPKQVKYYNQVFSTVTLVVGAEHVVKAMYMIPDWWGVVVAHNENNSVSLNVIRETKQNKNINHSTVSDLLSKQELIKVLRENAPRKSYSGMSKSKLRSEAYQWVPSDKLIHCVSNTIAKRESRILSNA